jgi:hypothetical protein
MQNYCQQLQTKALLDIRSYYVIHENNRSYDFLLFYTWQTLMYELNR